MSCKNYRLSTISPLNMHHKSLIYVDTVYATRSRAEHIAEWVRLREEKAGSASESQLR
jgi:hypothetical protein